MKITVDELLDLTLVFNKVEIIKNGQVGGGGTVLLSAQKYIWENPDYEKYANETVRYIEPDGNTIRIEI